MDKPNFKFASRLPSPKVEKNLKELDACLAPLVKVQCPDGDVIMHQHVFDEMKLLERNTTLPARWVNRARDLVTGCYQPQMTELLGSWHILCLVGHRDCGKFLALLLGRLNFDTAKLECLAAHLETRDEKWLRPDVCPEARGLPFKVKPANLPEPLMEWVKAMLAPSSLGVVHPKITQRGAGRVPLSMRRNSGAIKCGLEPMPGPPVTSRIRIVRMEVSSDYLCEAKCRLEDEDDVLVSDPIAHDGLSWTVMLKCLDGVLSTVTVALPQETKLAYCVSVRLDDASSGTIAFIDKGTRGTRIQVDQVCKRVCVSWAAIK